MVSCAGMLFEAKGEAARVNPLEALAYASRDGAIAPVMAAVIPDAVWQAMADKGRVLCLTHADPQVRMRALLAASAPSVTGGTPEPAGPRRRR